MPAVTIGYAILLVLVGAVAYALTGATTALIPSGIGLIVGVCGVLALAQPTWRKHAMHAAVAVALMGALAMLHPLRGQIPDPNWRVLVPVLITIAASVVYLVLGVRSFIAARRARQGG